MLNQEYWPYSSCLNNTMQSTNQKISVHLLQQYWKKDKNLLLLYTQGSQCSKSPLVLFFLVNVMWSGKTLGPSYMSNFFVTSTPTYHPCSVPQPWWAGLKFSYCQLQSCHHHPRLLVLSHQENLGHFVCEYSVAGREVLQEQPERERWWREGCWFSVAYKTLSTQTSITVPACWLLLSVMHFAQRIFNQHFLGDTSSIPDHEDNACLLNFHV